MQEFKCKHCGKCCSFIVKLRLIDVFKIMKLGYKKKEFATKDARGNSIIKIINGDCFFLRRQNNKSYCKVYNQRPKVCRQYPSELQLKECSAYKDTIL